MARPETVRDVERKTIQIATFEVAELTALPALMRCYVALVETVQKMGGEIQKNYSSVMVHIPKDNEQLAEQLKSEQANWDRNADLYELVLAGKPIKSYQEYSLTEWAKKEGLGEPEFVKEDEDASV